MFLNLLTLFGGAGWLAKEAIKESRELSNDRQNTARINQHVQSNTDPQLEAELREKMKNPKYYNEIWERIEKFKQDNPSYCKAHEEKAHYFDGPQPIYLSANFGWQNVGRERLPFFNNGSPYGRNQSEATVLGCNRELALRLLMQTYNKVTVEVAQNNAKKIYPYKKSTRSW